MPATILGISGSPTPNSNTDQAVQAVLAACGHASEFIKLSKLDMEPCRACLGCKENNHCVVHDDAALLAEKFRAARAVVIGGYTPYSSLDSRTKMFMERMYCLRHQTGLNRGKLVVSVITTACPPDVEGMPPAAETALNQLRFWIMEEGMNDLGAMVVLGNVPCIRCGHGDDCELSGVKMLFGPNATVEALGVNRFTDAAELRVQARELGIKLRTALDAAPSMPLPVHG